MTNKADVPVTLTSLFESLFGECNYSEFPELFEDILYSDWKKDMAEMRYYNEDK